MKTIYTKPIRMPDTRPSRTTDSIEVTYEEGAVTEVNKLEGGKRIPVLDPSGNRYSIKGEWEPLELNFGEALPNINTIGLFKITDEDLLKILDVNDTSSLSLLFNSSLSNTKEAWSLYIQKKFNPEQLLIFKALLDTDDGKKAITDFYLQSHIGCQGTAVTDQFLSYYNDMRGYIETEKLIFLSNSISVLGIGSFYSGNSVELFEELSKLLPEDTHIFDTFFWILYYCDITHVYCALGVKPDTQELYFLLFNYKD